MSRSLPWDDISLPTVDYTVRLVAKAGAIPVFWGRDSMGRCLLIVELQGDHTEEYRRGVTTVHGLEVDLRQGEEAHQQRLVLTLDRNVDQDLFLGLCETLIANLAPVVDPHVALAVTLGHIKRWKAFLAGRRVRLLSGEEVRGLIAELHFMRALYGSRLSKPAAIEAWCGVEDVHQDFIFGNTAVEVKSLAGRDRSTVRISSEDQLDTVLDHLFLVVHRLSEGLEAGGALSLNALVELIEDELGDAEALEQFSGKLADFGYAPLIDYDEPRMIVSGRATYRVEGDFPRLVRSGLPGGIARVKYEIELEAMKDFECSIDEVLKGV
ncbi:MAG TPA: PD-(D/E)XK motif protein [Caulobacteraceae bacterium]